MKNLMKLSLAAAFMATVASATAQTYKYPFQNPNLSVEERTENLISLLTPQEKVGLMMNKAISIDRLNIPSINWWNGYLYVCAVALATVAMKAAASESFIRFFIDLIY